MPSFNEITGARISSGVHVKGTDKDKFAQGWDLLWGKKEEIVSADVEKADWNENCAGWKECYHCDNGWFPCNQYCMIME